MFDYKMIEKRGLQEIIKKKYISNKKSNCIINEEESLKYY